MAEKRLRQKMAQRMAHSEMLAIRGFLNEWDPYELVAGGAPENELESEAQCILGKLHSGEVKTQADLAAYISALFSKQFEPIFTPGNCAGIAQVIWAW